jgi:beta-galactosidase
MIKPLIVATLLCAGTPMFGQGALPAQALHPKILLDADWKFLRGDANQPLSVVGTPILSWQWFPAPKGIEDGATQTDPKLDDKAGPWQTVPTGTDVFKGKVGFAWFRTSLPQTTSSTPTIHFETVDDNADVYLNGKLLVHHEGWNEPFDVPLKPAWSTAGPNLLAVLVENTNGEGGITGKAYLTSGPEQLTSALAVESYDDRAWRHVHLPHDYVVEGRFSEKEDNSHASLPRPPAWYRKSFMVPQSAKGMQVAVQFDGVYRNSTVWVNGHELGTHPSGYTGFRYDIAPYVHYGQMNLIAVHVDPSHNEGWWYEGGGIYRHVWLDIAPPISIAPNGIFVSTSLPEPQLGTPVGTAQVEVMTGLVSKSKTPAEIQVNTKILDEKGNVVESAQTLIGYPASTRAPTVLTVDRPNLWSVDRPYLYRVKTELEQNGQVVDVRVTPFGIRTVRFDPDRGLILNGERIKIQGVCNHQDFAGIGIAVPDSMEFWRVRKLKEMGCNAWRMSHNPPTPSVLDACDRLGMLVMDENRNLGDSPQVLGEVASMVQRDRNHPSIIMWSMCNEEEAAGTDRGGKIFAAMKDTVIKFDTTRPVTSAMNSGWFGTGFTGLEDVMGVNYNYDVYDKFHQAHPEIPLFGSETASTVTTRGEYADDKAKCYVSSYNMTDDSWQPVANRAFVAGSFVWTGFDYKGEPSPYSWPCINSNFGIMDLCGFPKDNYFYYQSWWKAQPIVHIMPHWNWAGKEGQKIRVVVFSNAFKVDLQLNGVSLGMQDMPRNGHLEWSVPYAPGTLVAKGLDATGTVVATHHVETTGPPVAVRLKYSRTRLVGNGEDMEPITVEIVDGKGRVCPTANNRVNFSITGAGYVAGVGNGNPADHDPDKARYRNAFNGKCLVLVGAGEKTGPIQLTVASPTLKPATLSLTSGN